MVIGVADLHHCVLMRHVVVIDGMGCVVVIGLQMYKKTKKELTYGPDDAFASSGPSSSSLCASLTWHAAIVCRP